MPGGELYQDLLERLFLALDWIMEDAKENTDSGRDILILTHEAVILLLFTVKDDLGIETSYSVINLGNAKTIKLGKGDLEGIRRKIQPGHADCGGFKLF